MITLKNTQRKIAINNAQLKKTAQKLLDALGYADFDLGIWLTTNKTIRNYNKTYRNKDKATDILSFPYHPELQAGQKIVVHTHDDKNLGDIIISLEYVKKDAPRWGHTFEQRMDVLLVHGICHLLGYDHIQDSDYKVMHKKETVLLNLLQR